MRFLMQKLQAGMKKDFCWVPGRCCQKNSYGCGPRWFGGVFLAEFTRSRPRRQSLFVMSSYRFCFSHVPQRGAVGKRDVLIRMSPFVRQMLQVFLIFMHFPKMMLGIIFVSYVVGVLSGRSWLVKGQQSLCWV